MRFEIADGLAASQRFGRLMHRGLDDRYLPSPIWFDSAAALLNIAAQFAVKKQTRGTGGGSDTPNTFWAL